MNYLLDTDAAIAIMNGRPAAVRVHFRDARQQGEALAISAVALFELYYGIARSQLRQQNVERLRIFLSGDVDIVAFEPADAEIAGDVRAHLRNRGTPIGPYDLLIAAQGLRRGLTVVTANIGEFARVEGLLCEDWSVPT